MLRKSLVLKNTELFREFSDAELDELLSSARRKSYKKGSVIFQKGDEGGYLYIVISGSVEINSTSETGKQVLLNFVRASEIFGEVAIIDGGARTANAVASADTELAEIPRMAFQKFLARHPHLYHPILMMTCRWLRNASAVFDDLAFLEVPNRIAKTLLLLSAKNNILGSQNAEVHISQEALANMLCLTRETVNKALREMEARNLVSLARQKITIKQLDNLKLEGSNQ